MEIQMEDQDIVFSDDVRVQELQSCHYIFPDLKVDLDNLSGSLEVQISFEDGLHLNLVSEENSVQESTLVNHLPPIALNVQLPSTYPEVDPPIIDIDCNVLTESQISELKSNLIDIWKSLHDQVLYSMVDHIQNDIINMFGESYQVCNPEVYFDLLKLDRKIKKDEFNAKTFTCEICQDDNKGIKCSRIEGCGHVFCNDCLYDCFANYIRSGEVSNIHCPDFGCTKEYVSFKEKAKSIDNFTMKPSEIVALVERLLKPPISLNFLSQVLNGRNSEDSKQEEDLVKRYYRLFQKNQYEFIGTIFPRRVIECPKLGCGERLFKYNMSDNLMICNNCKHVFCAICLNSFHGDYKACKLLGKEWFEGILLEDLKTYIELPDESMMKENIGSHYGIKKIAKAVKLYELECLFEDFKKESGVMACPVCDTVVERIDGCNKITCYKCNTSFCYLCGEKISGYSHFNDAGSDCAGKLFHGAPGHDDDDNFIF
ncbi:hypothetical protein DFJ63DRAFT_183808 [Scheffersomyces coipomensis]|uniref:uncharacterized protein n=1 Tax=Scheffersomyces coipomensis TaxID=1788519 RepID=UPI00315D919C